MNKEEAKEEAIEHIELTHWTSTHESEETLFKHLHDIAQEYKENTGDSILDDIFTDYLSEYDVTKYVRAALRNNGFSRLCVIVHGVHHLDAGVYVRDMHGNLRDYDHKDTLYIRSEILRRLKSDTENE